MTSLSNACIGTPAAIDALRTTLKHLEESWEVTPGDPMFLERKNTLLRAITPIERRNIDRSTLVWL